jgi:hypothetical protein
MKQGEWGDFEPSAEDFGGAGVVNLVSGVNCALGGRVGGNRSARR